MASTRTGFDTLLMSFPLSPRGFDRAGLDVSGNQISCAIAFQVGDCRPAGNIPSGINSPSGAPFPAGLDEELMGQRSFHSRFAS